MSDNPKRWRDIPNRGAAFLIAIASAGFGFSLGTVGQILLFSWIHPAPRKPDTAAALLLVFVQSIPVYSLLILFFATVPAVFTATLLYRLHLDKWQYFIGAGFITAALTLGLVFIIFGKFAVLGLQLFGGGITVSSAFGGFGAWFYLYRTRQLPKAFSS